jgi:hypothetical protein
MSTLLEKLKAPFHPDDLEVRVGMATKAKDKGMLLFYVTSRAIMDRLDEVVGPDRWFITYSPAVNDDKNQSVQANLTIIMDDGTHITKSDVGINSQTEPVKGGYSDSIKRAAVHWGMGRYLYNFPVIWHPLKDGRLDFNTTARTVVDANFSKLKEFMPEGYQPGKPSADRTPPAAAPKRDVNTYTPEERTKMRDAVTGARKRDVSADEINAAVRDGKNADDIVARINAL